jgi:DNA-binding Lrp family transcriptional regulator
MDATDAAILREMLRDRVLFWGTRDPRVSAETMARRLHLAPTTVRARLRRWERAGFLLRYAVVPHPVLFGLEPAFTTITVPDVRAKSGALKALRLVGDILAILDHVGPYVGVALVRANAQHEARVRRLLESLPGVESVDPCHPLPTPACRLAPSALDWKVLGALQQDPSADIGALARRVGVSRRTFARRYARLVREHAAWFTLVTDFANWEGAVVRAIVTSRNPSQARPGVLGALRRAPGLIDLERMDPPPGSPIVADGFFALRSAAEGELLRADLLGLPSVDEVEILYPRIYEVMSLWANERAPQPGNPSAWRARAPGRQAAGPGFRQ